MPGQKIARKVALNVICKMSIESRPWGPLISPSNLQLSKEALMRVRCSLGPVTVERLAASSRAPAGSPFLVATAAPQATFLHRFRVRGVSI